MAGRIRGFFPDSFLVEIIHSYVVLLTGMSASSQKDYEWSQEL